MLDLFKLHSKEDKSHSWIWVSFSSNRLKKEYLKLLKKTNQKSISKIVSNNLNSGFSTIEKHLIKLKNSNGLLELPLPLIIELTNLINKNYLKYKIIKNMNYFVCKNSPTKQKINAVKITSETFAKLIGAHIADGFMSKNEGYRIKICDGRKDSIEICKKWINILFNYKSRVYFNNIDHTWNCTINSKIIARYFNNIFNIPTGKKSYIIKEPNTIKCDLFKIRKSFASGFLMFDGGIKTTGMISISSMSKDIIDDLYNILKLDDIEVNTYYNPKKKSWLLESTNGRNKDYLKKLLSYFEKGTWKYNRLKFFIENRKYSLKDLNYLFPKHYLSKISLNDIYNSISKIKTGKIDDISKELKNKVANTTIYKYLYILEKANLIYKTAEKNTNGKNWWSETIYNLNCSN